MSEQALLESPPQHAVGGKYLTFALGKEEFGLEILKVREIIGIMDITAVPRSPASVRGIINLRGQVISVVDLRACFGMPSIEKTEQSCIIVVETTQAERSLSIGLMVDRVSEVLEIPQESIEEPTRFGISSGADCIVGVGKIDQSVKILLDVDRVIAGNIGSGF